LRSEFDDMVKSHIQQSPIYTRKSTTYIDWHSKERTLHSALYTLKRALHKRALYTPRRALDTRTNTKDLYPRALYTPKTALHTLKEPSTKVPSAREPYILSREPYILSKKFYALA